MSRRTTTRSEAGRGASLPTVASLRVTGPGAARARRPLLGARLVEDDTADAVLVTVDESDAHDATRLAAALPDPASLPPGTRVLVAADAASSRSLTGRLFAAIGRAQGIPRVVRCTALLLRGYDEVGGGFDPETSADLAWGRRAPAVDRAVTRPCSGP